MFRSTVNMYVATNVKHSGCAVVKLEIAHTYSALATKFQEFCDYFSPGFAAPTKELRVIAENVDQQSQLLIHSCFVL